MGGVFIALDIIIFNHRIENPSRSIEGICPNDGAVLPIL